MRLNSLVGSKNEEAVESVATNSLRAFRNTLGASSVPSACLYAHLRVYTK